MMASTLSREEIVAYFTLEQRRKTEQRKVDAIEREAKPYKEKIRAYVEENGGSDRTCTHYGYVIALLDKGPAVEWKNEFIALAGADAAVKLQGKADHRFSLSVELAGVVASP
jgi:hypothetical protein